MKPSFKSIDLFKRLPKDLTEGTYSGAILSILGLMIMISLVMFEISAYFDDKITSVLEIEQIDPSSKMYINMDIDFPSCPCDVLSLDIQDEMGSHLVDVGDTLKKVRRNQPTGTTDIVASAIGNPNIQNPIERAIKSFESGEGCALKGYISVNRVPGNFHIGSHAYREILMILGKNINLTHTINHLSFGKKRYITSIKNKFDSNIGELMPLNGHSELSEQYGKTTNYQINLVPTNYRDSLGLKYPVNQFTYAVGSDYTGNEVVYFKYGITGITVNYYQTADTFFQFIIGICTIIGGVFTVFGLLSVMINKSLNVLFKERIGKKD